VGSLCGIAVQGRVSIQYAVQLLLLVVALVVYHRNILLQLGVHPSAKGVQPVCLFDDINSVHFLFPGSMQIASGLEQDRSSSAERFG